ncbi:BZ3500_MvSof-1268-A1-R1_Chr2-1g04235 [Microbotryum saponariae]|uniref:BZ3500_MvSof-1268-A1-R1_Chr2-1g04235 protein n=1 Tax=Microbotryum saponariae TaxID=289078 RepID=A0A2X0M221_9BASI|nr:BZ3500_MvSof-1268-A1-R1_Chr2-1g04235 [Microbotryum saponariae]SCZ91222.1 BZ3501_MvSof-1269-A2-R1_Chr2-1g03891 [Microbotryum saponariae]
MVPTSAVTTKENNGRDQDSNTSTAIDEPKTETALGGAPVMRSLSAHPLLSPRARGLKIRIMRFTPSWFSVTMGTGIVNTLLFDLPWDETHAAFRAIGAAFLVLDIILWVVFLLLTVSRYIMYPRFFTAMVTHETHSLFLGTIPMGLVTIASGIARTGSEYGVAHSLNIGIVLWWIANVMSIATAFGVPCKSYSTSHSQQSDKTDASSSNTTGVMFTKQQHATETLTAAWLLPVVPTITQGAVGSSLCRLLLEDNRLDYAFTIWIISYIMTGIGTLLAMGLLVLYLQRLVLHRLPPREVIISTFLPLGPCGQAGFALIELGRDAVDMLPRIASMYPDREGLQQLALLGAPLLGAGLLTALVFWGLGIWWAFNAFTSVGTDLFKRRIAFNMGFWGLTFPLGSMTLATFSLARLFDSNFFSVLSAIMTFAVTCFLQRGNVPASTLIDPNT